eukprot:COSAG02_NODE_2963_length_7646_cov_10.941036_6_plen_145_part_00
MHPNRPVTGRFGGDPVCHWKMYGSVAVDFHEPPYIFTVLKTNTIRDTMPKKTRKSKGGGIVPVQCADKASEEEMAPPQAHWASMPRCCKAVIVGPAHVGKSSLVHNLLLRSNGEGEGCWGAIYVAHGNTGHIRPRDYEPNTMYS